MAPGSFIGRDTGPEPAGARGQPETNQATPWAGTRTGAGIWLSSQWGWLVWEMAGGLGKKEALR